MCAVELDYFLQNKSLSPKHHGLFNSIVEPPMLDLNMK